MPDPLRLPVEMTIYTAGDTLAALREWAASLQSSDSADVQGDAVAEIDGAGLQLLVALQHSLAQAGCTAHWHTPSGTLARACALLGPGAPFGSPQASRADGTPHEVAA